MKDVKVVKYNENSYFLGRNGEFQMSGMELMEVNNNIVLHPITSKGLIGRATLTIPKEHVQEVIEALRLIPHK
jgi:hypothetical protein